MLYKICTDLETSKKLKEIKIKIETYFYWNQGIENQEDTYYLVHEDERAAPQRDLVNEIPAYTLEQLLHILPFTLPGAHESTNNHLYLRKDMWWNVGYPYNGTNCFQISDYNNEGLATIFGKLIIKLKEAKKI